MTASIGQQLNNPFNLRPSPLYTWHGELTPCEGFCRFASLEMGLRAGMLNLFNTVRAGFNTPHKLVYHYAPPEENDSAGYLAGVCKSTGWGADDAIPIDSEGGLVALGAAFLIEEQGRPYVDALPPRSLSTAAFEALAAA
jgi:hypothetical protein